MKKSIFVMSALLLLLPSFVFAKIEITEIMYDVSGTDTGREWIEIYNSGTEPIELLKVKVVENNIHHKVDSKDSLTTLASLGYAVIADNTEKFLIDYPNFQGIVVDSAFSLLNTGEVLGLEYDEVVEDEVTYLTTIGANGDGNSLHKVGSSWEAHIPTPGQVASTDTIEPETPSETDTPEKKPDPSTTSPVTSTHAAQVSLSSLPEVKLKIDAGRERIVSINTPIEFEGRMTANSKEVMKGSYHWTFGDGYKDSGTKVQHTFLFPGEYNIVVNGYFEENNAVSRTKVKVIKPELTIKEININEGYIEILNESTNETNIGNWSLTNNKKEYIFPEDTIISSKKSIKFPLQFQVESGSDVLLLYPTGNEVSRKKTEPTIPMKTISEITDAIELLAKEVQLLP